jgi:hypothetical protein
LLNVLLQLEIKMGLKNNNNKTSEVVILERNIPAGWTNIAFIETRLAKMTSVTLLGS